MEQKTVLITGVTGLVGSYLTKVFLENGHRVYALARASTKETPEQRVTSVMKFWDETILIKNSGNLRILDGDITKEKLGLDDNAIDLLKKEVDEIFHCAASIQFNLSLDAIRNVNVKVTGNILEFALLCKSLKKVNHISTAYICGNIKGVFTEENLDLGQTLPTTYQQSKFEAEKVVLNYRRKGLWVDIFRPPFVVGESSTGKTITFHAFYQTLYLWVNEIFDVFPGEDCYLNIIPVDVLSQSILKIAYNTKLKNKTYHPFNSQLVSLNEIFNVVNQVYHFKTKLVSFEEFDFNSLTPAQKIIIKNNILYLNKDVSLDSTKTNEILKEYGFVFPEINKNILLKLVEFAINKHPSRSIKEQ